MLACRQAKRKNMKQGLRDAGQKVLREKKDFFSVCMFILQFDRNKQLLWQLSYHRRHAEQGRCRVLTDQWSEFGYFFKETSFSLLCFPCMWCILTWPSRKVRFYSCTSSWQLCLSKTSCQQSKTNDRLRLPISKASYRLGCGCKVLHPPSSWCPRKVLGKHYYPTIFFPYF